MAASGSHVKALGLMIPQAVRCPFGVAAMRARHVVGIGAMPTTAVAALIGSDTPAAMEDLDGARGDADNGLK
jgi:hypothetical protein